MSVNNQRVVQIVNNALRNARGTSIFQRLEIARNSVMMQREHGACNDMDLVAADHYLESRMQAATAPALGMWIAGSGNAIYETGKFIAWLTNLSELTRTGNCPTSPPSLDVIRWSIAGARNGQRDHENPPTYLQPVTLSDFDLVSVGAITNIFR